MLAARAFALFLAISTLLASAAVQANPAAPAALENDAGSGGDAPADLALALAVRAGPVLAGNLTAPLGGPGPIGDVRDTFAFHSPAATRIEVRFASTGNACLTAYGSTGGIVGDACADPGLDAVAWFDSGAGGRFALAVSSTYAQSYHFSIGVGELATPVGLLPKYEPPPPPRPNAASHGPRAANAVIALLDDGVNPYHEAFRDDSPRALQHPSTYLPGFPADAEAIRLTFGHENLVDALAGDCAEWSKVELGKLYWFPGTRVVGAIAFPPSLLPSALAPAFAPPLGGPVTCGNPEPLSWGNLVGAGGHGTMTASRAAGREYGACPDCLVVLVQGLDEAAVRWAGNQPWIDVQSNSWGPVTPTFAPVDEGGYWTSPALARAVEEAAAKQLAFWAAGNGILFRQGYLGHPTQAAPHFGPSAIRVGGTDSGRVALWPGSSPHVVSDACDAWAAEHRKNGLSTGTTASGTSGSTPFVAGTVARVLLEARLAVGDAGTGARAGGALAVGAPAGTGPLADGTLTRDELFAAAYGTADPRPAATVEDGPPCSVSSAYGPTPVEWASVPPGPAAIPLVGYGAVTRATGDEAVRALLGEVAPPARTVEDAWFAADRALRSALLSVYGAAP